MKSLRGPIEMIKKIEFTIFDSSRLQELRSSLINETSSLSGQLQSLDQRLYLLHSRANMFYHLFNFILLLDVLSLLRIKSWKESFNEQHAGWLEALAEIEYVANLSAVAHNNPDFVFPAIADVPYQIIGKDIGHPMIKAEQRVINSFECRNKQIFLITGSNMSGKSTFLRTIAVNAILGRLGSVVCASSFTVSDFVLFTVMRTEDSLDENISSFYAELKRIRQMLEFIESEKRVVLVLMDEILKGTNSADRNNGTQGLIGQLAQEEALSFISTHDLTLATLPEVINYNFSSDIIDGEIIFDYRLKEGVCQSFNASELMKQIGIRIEEN
jgi:DNA mismatch repair ATPase MutS